LIAEGFLDSATTEQLAKRVGYSSRQLVRLFEKQIGASPDFVGRARRAHLARRLLDESDLSITKVAFAAGFSSLRQMNRVVRDLFKFSPTQLRAKRSKKQQLNLLDGGLRLKVPFVLPFDDQRMINYFADRAIPGVEAVEDKCYRRTMLTCGHPGVVEVRASDASDHLDVTMHLATFGSIIDEVERVRSLFGINSDHSDALSYLRKDKWLGATMKKQPGIRLPGAWDRFETAVRIIVGQQVSVAGASTVTGRIVKRFGKQIEVPLPGSLAYVFPAPSVLAKAKVQNFDMPKSRANTIKQFAAAVANGDIDLTMTGSLEKTTKALERLPGIGPWTSNFIAGRVMRQPDAFPASDLGLRKGAARLVGGNDLLSETDLIELAEQWRPFRATAAAYLWMANDALDARHLSPNKPRKRPAIRKRTSSRQGQGRK
jgi:AraC family transcriptional regulator of adaptative response / DNA-3-methyladenine glycosylase II